MIADHNSPTVVVDDEDDDFGDFEESAGAVAAGDVGTSQSAPDVREIEVLEDLDVLFDTIETMLNDTLQDESQQGEAMDCSQILLNELLHNQGLNEDTSSLWSSLKVIEEAVALKFTYLESNVFKTYSKSLNLDVSLAKLQRRNVPRFALYFNPLETLTPEKLPISLNSDDLDVLESAANCSSTSKNVARNSNGVKPVVNLDLNYFVSNDHSLSSMDSITNPPKKSSPVLLSQTTRNGGTVLEKNVNKLTNSILPKVDIATVQSEALKLAEKLPDLNFMLSPVLMFPLKETCGSTPTNDNIGTNGENTFVNKQVTKDCDKF